MSDETYAINFSVSWKVDGVEGAASAALEPPIA